ncbi:hypothetical protein G6F54_014509 [Rhizopus delemar]|nr:hypothetical protein G6F54_014509 [Rhizopus delemar]
MNKATYGAIAAKAAAITTVTSRRPPSKKRKLAASRPFQPVDPSAPHATCVYLVLIFPVSWTSAFLAQRPLVS